MGHPNQNSSADAPHLSVIVPAFNEAARLFDNLSALYRHLEESGVGFELVVIDDGSSDDTAAEAIRFADSHSNVEVIEHPFNLGLGQALKSGFKRARGRYLVTFDSDLSYAPEHIVSLVETIEATGASVVIASPYMEGGSVSGVPRMRALMSKWANWILRRLSLRHISTVTGMVRAYDHDFIEGLSLKSMDNQINAEIIYKAILLRRSIIEIPAELVWTRDEEDTKERRGNLRFTSMIIDSLFSGFIFRPFSFFIIPGFIVLILALYSLGWAGYHFFSFLGAQSGSIDAVISAAAAAAFAHSPHSIVIGGIGLIVAIQLLSVGIISAQNKRYFEEIWFQGDWTARQLLAQAKRSSEDQARDLTF